MRREVDEGRLSRRQFIGASAAAAAGMAMSPLAAEVLNSGSDMTTTAPGVFSKSGKVVRVGQGEYAGLTHAAIQKAVDDVAAGGGGVVEVPAGVYEMTAGLQLRSGVHVRGERGTVLRKVPSVTCGLKGGIGYAQHDFAAERPELLSIGMAVHLTDKNAGGWYDTVGTIIARQGERFILDTPASHDYNAGGGGKITSVFPVVAGRGVVDAGIEDVAVDAADETRDINGCVGGGVWLFNSRRVLVKGVEVRHWKGDGISIQKCTDVFVRGCDVHHSSAIGLHPGTGSVRYVFENNRLHDNQATGLFFCMNTRFSLVRGNVIENNGTLGIQVNERDSDHWIEGNTIRGNGWAGIGFNVWEMRSGDRIHFQGNTLAGNCTKEGSAEIWLRRPLRDIHILDNRIDPAAGKMAMQVAAESEAIYCAGNTVGGRAMGKGDVTGEAGLVRFERPKTALVVKPSDMPLDGAMHLGIPKLGRFEERG